MFIDLFVLELCPGVKLRLMEPALLQSYRGTSSSLRKRTGATGNQALVLESRQAATSD